MLHRIHTTEHGVLVCPTMSFDERGHRPNHKVYYVLGYQENGQKPEAFYPTVEEFIGEGGTFTRPRAVCEAYLGVPAGTSRAGREAMALSASLQSSWLLGKAAGLCCFLG